MRKREITQDKQERGKSAVLHSSRGQRVLFSDGLQDIILLHFLPWIAVIYVGGLSAPCKLQAQSLPLSSLEPLHVGLALNRNPVTVG